MDSPRAPNIGQPPPRDPNVPLRMPHAIPSGSHVRSDISDFTPSAKHETRGQNVRVKTCDPPTQSTVCYTLDEEDTVIQDLEGNSAPNAVLDFPPPQSITGFTANAATVNPLNELVSTSGRYMMPEPSRSKRAAIPMPDLLPSEDQMAKCESHMESLSHDLNQRRLGYAHYYLGDPLRFISADDMPVDNEGLNASVTVALTALDM